MNGLTPSYKEYPRKYNRNVDLLQRRRLTTSCALRFLGMNGLTPSYKEYPRKYNRNVDLLQRRWLTASCTLKFPGTNGLAPSYEKYPQSDLQVWIGYSFINKIPHKSKINVGIIYTGGGWLLHEPRAGSKDRGGALVVLWIFSYQKELPGSPFRLTFHRAGHKRAPSTQICSLMVI